MKAISLISLIWALITVQLGVAFCQSPITFSAQFGVNDGLSERYISKIERDSDGYFWLLHESFLQRYDGRNFGDPIEQPIRNARYFKSISDEKILIISHDNSAVLFNTNTELITPVEFPKISVDHRLIDLNFICDSLVLIYQTQSTIESYFFNPLKPEEALLPKQKVDITVRTPDKVFDVGQKFLLIFDGATLYKVDNKTQENIRLNSLLKDQEQFYDDFYSTRSELYFSLPSRRGIFKYHNDSILVIHDFFNLSYGHKDNNGQILLGLSDSYRFSESAMLIDKDGKKSLWEELVEQDNTFTDVYSENFNDKLLCSAYTGLYYVKTKIEGIDKSHLNSNYQGKFGNVVMSFASDQDENIYYIKEAGGLFKYDDQNPIEIIPEYQLHGNVHMISDSNHLFIGGYQDNSNRGLLTTYNLKTKEIKESYFEYPVLYVYKETDDQLLLLSSSSQSRITHILDFNPITQTVKDTLLTIQNARARKIQKINTNEYLIATSTSLFIYNTKTKDIKTILEDIEVRTFIRDNQHWLIGTLGKGLYILDENFNTLEHKHRSDGFGTDHIYCMVKDDDGNIWVGANFNLMVLNDKYKFIRYFTMEDGISDYEFNSQAAIKTSSGQLFMGTINGVTSIQPRKALSILPTERANIQSIQYTLNGTTISQNIINQKLEIDSRAKDLILPIRRNDFILKNEGGRVFGYDVKIAPAATSFTINKDNIFIPRLPTKETSITFVSKSDPSIEIGKIKLLRFYDYTLFYILSLALVVISFLSYLISKSIIRNNKRRESEKKEYQVKMAELELQALRSQMNPHFIFNSLGAILLYLQTNERKKAEKYLTKFAKLMRMFLESSKAKFISFNEELELLDLYLQLEKLRFEDKFTYHFEVDDSIDRNNFVLPSMLLQPFIENAINHGIYHKKTNDGLLNLTAIPDGEMVKIIIEDNGIGRKAAGEIKSRSLKKHKSRASEIIQERINVLKIQKNINIDIEFQDLEENNNPTGTRVIITIPKLIKEE